MSNVTLGALWAWFTVLGYLAARRRHLSGHRRHMVRSAPVALSVITDRISTPTIYITLHPLQDSVFGGSTEHLRWFAAGVGSWLGWTVPLGILH